MAALAQLEAAYAALRHDPVFWADLRELLERFAGRPDRRSTAPTASPTPSLDEAIAADGADAVAAPAPPLPQARGPRPHRRAQDQQRARPGAADPPPRQDPGHRRDRRRPARRRDGDGVRAARPAVRRLHGRRGHRAPAARTCCGCTRSAPRSGRSPPARATLKDAINEAMRDWVTNVETTHYVLGSAMGPHPYPTIVRDLQRRIGDEAAAQIVDVEGRLPDLALACVGGGSNAIGLLARFIGEPSVRARGRRGGRRRHRDRPPRRGDRSAARRASSTARAR